MPEPFKPNRPVIATFVLAGGKPFFEHPGTVDRIKQLRRIPWPSLVIHLPIGEMPTPEELKKILTGKNIRHFTPDPRVKNIVEANAKIKTAREEWEKARRAFEAGKFERHARCLQESAQSLAQAAKALDEVIVNAFNDHLQENEHAIVYPADASQLLARRLQNEGHAVETSGQDSLLPSFSELVSRYYHGEPVSDHEMKTLAVRNMLETMQARIKPGKTLTAEETEKIRELARREFVDGILQIYETNPSRARIALAVTLAKIMAKN